uniref:Uncharacterized protein n=1 Tax=Amphimedon queenslandica TaxID=400682 RepID=A0A1X7V9T8_AMPQE
MRYTQSCSDNLLRNVDLLTPTKSVISFHVKLALKNYTISVMILPVTATATLIWQKELILSLEMVDPVIVEVSLEKPNFFFSIKENTTDIIMAVT